MTKAVFFDRDGVINVKAPEGDYIKSPAELELLPGVDQAIGKLSEAGYLVFIATNQRGIARGLMTVDDLEDIHHKMLDALRATIDGIYFCPHDHSDECGCRKPKPGLLFRAAKDHDIVLERSWMVGDSESDIEAGLAAGCRTVLVTMTMKETKASHRVETLEEAVALILAASPAQDHC